jgi:hypothetical protein
MARLRSILATTEIFHGVPASCARSGNILKNEVKKGDQIVYYDPEGAELKPV